MKLDPEMRQQVDENVAATMREVHARGLLPLLMYCIEPGRPEAIYTLSCGPGVTAEVATKLLTNAARSIDRGKVSEIHPIAPPPACRPEAN